MSIQMKKWSLLASVSVLCAMQAWAKNGVEYATEDSLRVTVLLQNAFDRDSVQQMETGEVMVYFARAVKDLNIPYVAHTLELFNKERLIVNLREMDCTTYTETVTALTLCLKNGLRSFDAYCYVLQKLRYAQGDVPAYTKRLHYFTSWIEDNTLMGFCNEVQSPNPPFTAEQRVHVGYMTSHVSRYRMLADNPTDIPGIRKQEEEIEGRTYRYIPKEELLNNKCVRQAVHDGDIIAIITNIKGLDTQHIGIAVWHEDGVHLLNASSIHKQVVEEPMTLQQYLKKHKTMPGIRVVRLKTASERH